MLTFLFTVEVYLPSHDEADLPVINDTIITGDVIVVSTKVDTAAIIKDWISRRVYKPMLWNDDKKGKLELSLAVQYNTLTGLDYTYTPPNIRKKKWSVGVSVGPVVTKSGITGGVMLGVMYDLWQF